jgi:hypothetical protein
MSLCGITRRRLLAWLCLLAACAAKEPPEPLVLAADEVGPISGYFAPERTTYSAFEPIHVTFRVTNDSDDMFAFAIGGASRFAEGRDENVYVHIIGPDGKDLPLHLGNRGGLVGQVRLPPEGRHERELLLNSWVDLYEPGTYTVTMRHVLYSSDGVLPAFEAMVRSSFPPRLNPSKAAMRAVLIHHAQQRQRDKDAEEIAREVDLILDMPMIESRFEIEILPFDRQVLIDRVETLPIQSSGIVVQEGSSDALGILCLQLGLTQEQFSRENALALLHNGAVPRPRPDDFRIWLNQEIANCLRWGVPEPWPLPKWLMDQHRHVMEKSYPQLRPTWKRLLAPLM